MVLRYQKLGIERNSFKYTKRTKKKADSRFVVHNIMLKLCNSQCS